MKQLRHRGVASGAGSRRAKALLPVWRKHIGIVVDYTVGTTTNGKGKQDKAVSDLIGYTHDFGAFLSAATRTCPSRSWPIW